MPSACAIVPPTIVGLAYPPMNLSGSMEPVPLCASRRALTSLRYVPSGTVSKRAPSTVPRPVKLSGSGIYSGEYTCAEPARGGNEYASSPRRVVWDAMGGSDSSEPTSTTSAYGSQTLPQCGLSLGARRKSSTVLDVR